MRDVSVQGVKHCEHFAHHPVVGSLSIARCSSDGLEVFGKRRSCRQLLDFNGGDAEVLRQALLSRLGELRKVLARLAYPLLIHHERTEIGFREIPIVVASFLRSAWPNGFARAVPKQRLLLDSSAGVQQGALSLELGLQCPLDRGE